MCALLKILIIFFYFLCSIQLDESIYANNVYVIHLALVSHTYMAITAHILYRHANICHKPLYSHREAIPLENKVKPVWDNSSCQNDAVEWSFAANYEISMQMASFAFKLMDFLYKNVIVHHKKYSRHTSFLCIIIGKYSRYTAFSFPCFSFLFLFLWAPSKTSIIIVILVVFRWASEHGVSVGTLVLCLYMPCHKLWAIETHLKAR